MENNEMYQATYENFKSLSPEDLDKKRVQLEYMVKEYGKESKEYDADIADDAAIGLKVIKDIVLGDTKAPKVEEPKAKAEAKEDKPTKAKDKPKADKPKASAKEKRGRGLKLKVGDLVLEKNDPTIVGIVREIEGSVIDVDFGDAGELVETGVSNLARYDKYKFKDAKFKPAIEKELKDSGHPAFKEKQKRGRKPKSPEVPKPAPVIKEYKIEVGGKTFVFNDQKSADECEEAIKTAKKGINLAEAISEKKEDDSEAIKEGMEKASKVPVAQKITESFVSIAKKAVSEIPESKIKSNPKEIKSALDELDKAFNNLFDALEKVIGKQIGNDQRQQIMGILNSFEAKLDVEKKEDGGMIWGDDSWGKDNSWSYASFL